MTLHITLFYRPEVYRGKTAVNLRGRKPLALLTYLLLTHKAHTRQHLIDLLFSEAADPRGSLRWTLSHLRRSIGHQHIRATGGQLAFNFDGDYHCDVVDFLDGQTERYRGDLLENVYVRDAAGFMDWLLFEREHLRDVYQMQLITLLEQHRQRGEYEEVIHIAQRLMLTDNLREEWHRELIAAYARTEKREAALAQFDRCRQLLHDELGVAPSPQTEAMITAVRHNNFLPAKAGKAEGDLHLPPQSTTFVGREQEASGVLTRLENPACRLLTLVGVGGIGKTRLAIHSAAKTSHQFTHGIFFVPLETVHSAAELMTAIAKTLSLPHNEGDDLEIQLINYLRKKRTLLLLDNVEHLLTQSDWHLGENLLHTLLTSAPQLKLMLTSRERLNLQAEWVFDVDGLAFPQDGGAGDGWFSYPAVQLFLQRAQQIHPCFAPDVITMEELASVARICRLVRGVPLAIELASAWIRQRPCAEIARAIHENVDFLTSPLHDAPQRHASMRAVFDHSWALLTNKEKRTLAQLSIFSGGFNLTAAEEILSISLFDLSLLLDKSLLHRSSSNRYRLHMLIKQFAAGKRKQDPILNEAALTAHSQYFCRLLNNLAADLRGEQQAAASAQIATDLGNIHRAWERAIERADFSRVAQTAMAMGAYYETHGRHQEGAAIFLKAGETLKQMPSSGQQALALGKVLYWNGRFSPYLSKAAPIWAQIEPLLHRANADGLDIQADTARLLLARGQIQMEQRNLETAQHLFQQSQSLYQRIGDKRGQADAWSSISELMFFQGRLREAETAVRKNLALREHVKDRMGTVAALAQLSQTIIMQRGYDEGVQLAEKGVLLCRALHNPIRTANTLQALDWALFIAGRLEESIPYVEERLPVYIDLGREQKVGSVLLSLAWRNFLVGNDQKAKLYVNRLLNIVSDAPDNLTGSKCGTYYTLSQMAFMDGDYKKAYDRALIASQSLQATHQLSVVCMCLGMAALAVGDLAQARKHVYRGLQLRGIYALLVLHLAAILLGQQAETQAEKERPFFLLSLQRHHFPLTDVYFFHESTRRLWPASLSTLPPERIAAAEANGRLQSPEEAIARLLEELPQLWFENLATR